MSYFEKRNVDMHSSSPQIIPGKIYPHKVIGAKGTLSHKRDSYERMPLVIFLVHPSFRVLLCLALVSSPIVALQDASS